MELNCTALQQGASLPPLVPPDATLAKTGCCRMDLHSASHQRRPQLRAGRGRTPPGRRPPYSPDTAPSFTSGIQDGICVSPLSASERTESHILFELNYQGHARTPVRKGGWGLAEIPAPQGQVGSFLARLEVTSTTQGLGVH